MWWICNDVWCMEQMKQRSSSSLAPAMHPDMISLSKSEPNFDFNWISCAAPRRSLTKYRGAGPGGAFT